MTSIFVPQKVELIDSMGSDLSVVNAARVSFSKTKTEMDESDIGLISYLARHNHWTPFSQVTYQVRIKCPIFVARQWFKHQIGITRNEVSRRYVSDAPEYYMPDYFRSRPENMKQGSTDEPMDNNTNMMLAYQHQIEQAHKMYMAAIDSGVCPEQARAMLPQAMMTEFIETGSLQAAARIAHLRLDSHAQKEIQELAQMFSDQVARIAPVSWMKLTNNVYGD